MSQRFDLVVIGGGPGGYVAAIRAAQLGLQTALVEKDATLGGTCLNRGCIPTKVLLHAAGMLDRLGGMKQYGIKVEGHAFDWSLLRRRKRAVVTKNTKGIELLMKKNGIELFRGTGSITGPGKVLVTPEGGENAAVDGANIIIATGSAVASIPGADFDGVKVLSSDHALDLESVPESIVVLGGGAVGVEFASLFNSFGSEVTLVEMLPGLLPNGDREISEELALQLKKKRIDVRTGTRFSSFEQRGGGLVVNLEKEGGEKEMVEAAMLLVAVGRKPMTDGIGLDRLSIIRDRGFIRVGPHMETNVPGIYAIGDIVDTPALAHVASEEGVTAAETIAGRETETINYNAVPFCVYATPEVASAGLTAEQAEESGREVVTGRFPFSANPKASIAGAPAGFVKIVADRRHGEILGAHMIGPYVTEMISGITSFMQAGGTIEELGRAIHPHPTLSEAIHEAALAAGPGAIHGG